MVKTLAEQIEETVTNGLGYSQIRDQSKPMRDERTIAPWMSKQEIQERFETPVEETMYGVKSHLRYLEVKTKAFEGKLKEAQRAIMEKKSRNSSPIPLRAVN